MAIDEGKPMDRVQIDEECALWDWARTAGASACVLRETLRGSLLPGTGAEAGAVEAALTAT